MSRFLNFLWLAVLLPLCLVAAEVRVTNISAKPRFPWNGKFDISYSLECSDANANIEVTFQAHDNDRDEDVTMTTLSGDGVGAALKAGGPYKVVWDSTADYAKGHSSDLSFEITAVGVVVPQAITGTYLVVNLQTGAYSTSESAPSLSSNTCRSTELWLKRVSSGSFSMGSSSSELGRGNDETKHTVNITKDYYIGVFEMTQKQYSLIMGSNPSKYTGDYRPVESVSYDDIRGTTPTLGAGWPAAANAVDPNSFLGKLRSKTNLLFDLPTEAQWEYACRAGKTTALNTGSNLSATREDSAMKAAGRYAYNMGDGKGGSSYKQHTKVGSYTVNSWGLYDMHGNVAEWCLDRYGTLTSSSTSNPTGATTGAYRVIRGGNWSSPDAQFCRSAARSYLDPSAIDDFAGFRVVVILP